MTPLLRPQWRAEWLTLHDLAALLGKSYATIYKMHREGMRCSGITFVKTSTRVWVRIDRDTYDALIDA